MKRWNLAKCIFIIGKSPQSLNDATHDVCHGSGDLALLRAHSETMRLWMSQRKPSLIPVALEKCRGGSPVDISGDSRPIWMV